MCPLCSSWPGTVSAACKHDLRVSPMMLGPLQAGLGPRPPLCALLCSPPARRPQMDKRGGGRNVQVTLDGLCGAGPSLAAASVRKT